MPAGFPAGLPAGLGVSAPLPTDLVLRQLTETAKCARCPSPRAAFHLHPIIHAFSLPSSLSFYQPPPNLKALPTRRLIFPFPLFSCNHQPFLILRPLLRLPFVSDGPRDVWFNSSLLSPRPRQWLRTHHGSLAAPCLRCWHPRDSDDPRALAGCPKRPRLDPPPSPSPLIHHRRLRLPLP